jgi:hypothetical protein
VTVAAAPVEEEENMPAALEQHEGKMLSRFSRTKIKTAQTHLQDVLDAADKADAAQAKAGNKNAAVVPEQHDLGETSPMLTTYRTLHSLMGQVGDSHVEAQALIKSLIQDDADPADPTDASDPNAEKQAKAKMDAADRLKLRMARHAALEQHVQHMCQTMAGVGASIAGLRRADTEPAADAAAPIVNATEQPVEQAAALTPGQRIARTLRILEMDELARHVGA